MFCKFCGKEISSSNRFCPSCGKAQDLSVSTLKRNNASVSQPLLIVIGVAIIALLLVLVFRPFDNEKSKDTAVEQAAEQKEEVTIVGDWIAEDGVGITFAKDGTIRFKGGNFSFAGNILYYEIKDENTLYLYPEDLPFGVGVDIAYKLNGDFLYMEIDGLDVTLIRQ